MSSSYTSAAEAIYNSGLPTASYDKRGRRIPLDESMTPDKFEDVARLAVDAFLADNGVEIAWMKPNWVAVRREEQ